MISPRPTRRANAGPVVLLATLLLAAACSGGSDPAVELAEVTAATVVQTVGAPATVEPAASRPVTAPASGEVAEVLVDSGDRVRAGQTILRLSSEQVAAALEQARTGLDAAGALAGAVPTMDLSGVIAPLRRQIDETVPALLDTLENQIRTLDADLPELPAEGAVSGSDGDAQSPADLPSPVASAIERAEAEIAARAEAARDAAESARRQVTDRLARTRVDLLAQLATVRDSYREISTALAQAQAAAEDAAATATAAQRRAAVAQREQAETALEAARQRQQALEVTAPISGVVEFPEADQPGAGTAGAGAGDAAPRGATGALPPEIAGLLGGVAGGAVAGPVAPGAQVSVGQRLFTVYDLSNFHVEASVDEVDAVLVDTGQDAEVLVDAYPRRSFAARVARVGVGPESGSAGSVVYPVRVAFRGSPDATFRVGMTASVEIEVKRVEADTTVPASALVRRDEQDTVFVVRRRDGRRVATRVPVEVRATGADRIAVDGDLQAGDEVVVTGLEDLEDGDTVPGGA